MNTTATRLLRIGHSPDPDDAFMWYPLADFPDGSGPGGKTYTPRIDTAGYRFEHVLEDIESLNQRSDRGELEITALSMHQYPHIADRYALTSCGSSMGEGYGPMVVAREPIELRDLITPVATPRPDVERESPRDALRLAIPGTRTTAWLAFQLMMWEEDGVQPGADRTINYTVVPFDRIIPEVVAGNFDAGLIIHEGQLTYADAGLQKIVDLGEWWKGTRDLPLPLGGNAIRRDLGDQMPTICRVLYNSIEYALAHRAESIEYALNYARDMGADLADEFVGMYVNDYTLHYGETGRRAVQQLMDEAARAELIPHIGEVDFVEPG